MSTQDPPPSSNPPADWYPDPTGRFEYRYWDGQQWTEHVSRGGSTETDPLDTAQHAAADVEAAETQVIEREEPAEDVAPEGPGPVPDPSPQPTAGTPAPTGAGLRTDLLGDEYDEVGSDERVALQNRKMLKVVLGDDVLARQGSMVAFQGSVDFDYEGSGSVSKFLKKAMTGEGVALMRCSGRGELFLAHDADDVHVIWLEGGGLTVNGSNLLAFDPNLDWDIERIQGAGMLAGGLFNTTLRGHGWVAITTHGTPVALDVDQPTFADTDAAVAWSSSLSTSINRTFKAKALIGRGSGEVAQLSFSGQGFVIVQASEGPSVPPHNHGN